MRRGSIGKPTWEPLAHWAPLVYWVPRRVSFLQVKWFEFLILVTTAFSKDADLESDTFAVVGSSFIVFVFVILLITLLATPKTPISETKANAKTWAHVFTRQTCTGAGALTVVISPLNLISFFQFSDTYIEYFTSIIQGKLFLDLKLNNYLRSSGTLLTVVPAVEVETVYFHKYLGVFLSSLKVLRYGYQWFSKWGSWTRSITWEFGNTTRSSLPHTHASLLNQKLRVGSVVTKAKRQCEHHLFQTWRVSGGLPVLEVTW